MVYSIPIVVVIARLCPTGFCASRHGLWRGAVFRAAVLGLAGCVGLGVRLPCLIYPLVMTNIAMV